MYVAYVVERCMIVEQQAVQPVLAGGGAAVAGPQPVRVCVYRVHAIYGVCHMVVVSYVSVQQEACAVLVGAPCAAHELSRCQTSLRLSLTRRGPVQRAGCWYPKRLGLWIELLRAGLLLEQVWVGARGRGRVVTWLMRRVC